MIGILILHPSTVHNLVIQIQNNIYGSKTEPFRKWRQENSIPTLKTTTKQLETTGMSSVPYYIGFPCAP